MIHIVTLFLINCLLFQNLQGADVSKDVRKELAPEARELLKKLGDYGWGWHDRKQKILTLITKHYVHPDRIRYSRTHLESTALHEAIDHGDVAFTKILIDMEASIHSRADDLITKNCPPLFFAKTTEMAQLLLDNKASVNEKGGEDDTTPLLCHIVKYAADDQLAARIALYAKYNVDVHAVDEEHCTPLHELIFRPHLIDRKIKIMEKLIEVGVPIHAKGQGHPHNNMSVMQVLKTTIKEEVGEGNTWSDCRSFLAAMQTTIQDRVFKDVHSVLPRDPANIVVGYYDDGEFDTEEDIEQLVVQIAQSRRDLCRPSYGIIDGDALYGAGYPCEDTRPLAIIATKS